MYVKRKTINTKVSISGIGLHSGIYTKVELHPTHAGSGITFVRADLGLRIPALQASTTALTFGFKHEVEKLRAAGLARGGSVENCIVLDDGGVMNGPLRFRDEFVRHKVLDLIGDLALIGRPVVGEITAYKAGHALHSKFVEQILRAAEAEEGAPAMAARAVESFA